MGVKEINLKKSLLQARGIWDAIADKASKEGRKEGRKQEKVLSLLLKCSQWETAE